MKTKLLFTAALMAAAGMVTQNVYAGQSLVSVASVAAMSVTEEVEADPVSDDVTDYTSYVKNASCTVDNQNWWKPSSNASAYNVVEKNNRKGVEYWQDSPIANNTFVIKQNVQGLPAGQYKVTAKVYATILSDSEDKGVYLQGNNMQEAVKGISSDWNDVELICEVAEDGILELGVYAGESNESAGVALSDVHLYHQNTKRSLDLTVIAAESLQKSLSVEDELYTQAISTAKALADNLSAAEYKTAIDNLHAAMGQYLGENASATNVYDMTGRIINPDFTEASNKCSNTSSTDYQGWDRIWTGKAPDKSGSLVEYWNNTFEHSQELLNLPNGKYKVEVLARHLGTGGCLFANTSVDSKTVGINKNTVSGTTLWNGNLSNEAADLQTELDSKQNTSRISLEVLVTDGVMKIGMKSEAEGTWIVFRDFRLYYVGQDLTALEEVRTTLVEEAQKITATTITTAAYETLQAVIAEANKANTVSTLTSANNKLRATIDEMNVLMVSYSAYQTLLEQVNADLNNSTGDQETLNNVIADQNEAVNAVTTVKEIDAARVALLGAYQTYLENAVPTTVGYSVDLTFKLTNPQMRGDNWVGNRLDGWYHDIHSDDFSVKKSAEYAGDTKDPLIWEYLQNWSATILKPNEAGNGWAVYQKTDLPKGTYKLTAEVFGERGLQGTGVSATLAMGVGNSATVKGEAISYHNGEHKGFKLTTVYFNLNEEVKDAKLGVFVNEDNDVDKFGINDMRLYKIANLSDLPLDESSDTYNVAGDAYANVTMERTLKGDGKWNTFCVPFDMTAEQLKSNGITEVRALSGAEVDGDHAKLTFTPVTAIEAGKPYIVKANGATTLTVDGVVVKPATSIKAVTMNGITMVGNYAATTLNNNEFFISDNAFYVADREVSLKGFRAYITAASAGVNRMMIDIDGVTTSVEEVLGGDVLENNTVDVYSLSGVKLKGGVKKSEALEGLPKGIYVVGGKKVIK